MDFSNILSKDDKTFKITRMGKTRIRLETVTPKGFPFIIDMMIWLKNGRVSRFMKETLSIDTYRYRKNGECTGIDNPMLDRRNLGRIDFEWVLEANECNFWALVSRAISNMEENELYD